MPPAKTVPKLTEAQWAYLEAVYNSGYYCPAGIRGARRVLGNLREKGLVQNAGWLQTGGAGPYFEVTTEGCAVINAWKAKHDR